jgi:hypothetical protein
MAATPGGLTTSIRRKLQEGRTPEEVVQELVAGGLGQVSAQRFVDRALAEDATAAPLAPLPPVEPAPAPADSLDQFIQTKTAETEAANARSGGPALWGGSLLMCGGILITGISYIMADAGERFTLMWGPVVFGFLLWGKAVLQGFGNVRSFAWFSAAGSLAAPVVLAIVMFGVAVATEPSEEELVNTEIAELLEEARDSQPAGAQTVANRATEDAPSEVVRLLKQFEESEWPNVQCEAATRLATMTGEDAVDAVDGLMEHWDEVDAYVQGCIRKTVTKLDPQVRFPAPGR